MMQRPLPGHELTLTVGRDPASAVHAWVRQSKGFAELLEIERTTDIGAREVALVAVQCASATHWLLREWTPVAEWIW
jgi:hypothetical protein